MNLSPWLNVTVEFMPIIGKDGSERHFHLNEYRPHFRVTGDSEYLGISFFDCPQSLVRPSELVDAKVSLIYYPNVPYEKLKDGQTFDIIEGRKIVGKGTVKGDICF